jgi:hypothetical protein
MFNLHVGIPGIVPDLLNSIVQAGILKGDSSPSILSRKLWQEQFRNLINAKQKEAQFNVAAWRTTEATIADLSALGPVAVSQHALLGRPEDCFLKRKVLPYTDARIARISDLFAAVPLTIHLTISSQFDYLHTTMNRLPKGKTFPQPSIVPSWSELVRRIKGAAPDRQILVWDFESPEKIALAFMIFLLDTKDEELIDAIDAHLSVTIKRPETAINSPEIPHEMINRMDAQYDFDLEAINQIEGVSLILSDSIPDKLHSKLSRQARQL